MPHRPSLAELHWRKFADERHLGKPVSVKLTPRGYTITWSAHVENVAPFFGGSRAKKKIVADLQRWIANE